MDFIVDKKVLDKIKSYNSIMAMVETKDLGKDTDFKKIYCTYYGLNRNTSKKYQDIYFEYMEKNKNEKSLSYEKVLTDLSNKTDRIDYSFASKLMHTINPKLPILDRHVMRLLGFPLKQYGAAEDRIKYYVKVYETVYEEYDKIEKGLGKTKISKAIKNLDDMFLGCKEYEGLSVAKKIDSLIFRLKNERAPSILDIE